MFELQQLTVTAGKEVAHAHCLIRCGATLPSGEKVEDRVRATLCLWKKAGAWKITHQHISLPMTKG